MTVRLPIRLRLTLVFTVAMALVLAGLGAFLYLRLGSELLKTIDMGLRSRAQVIAPAIAGGGGLPPQTRRHLIDPDEAFVQLLDPSAAEPIVQPRPPLDVEPLVPVDLLAGVDAPTFFSLSVSGLEDPARLLAVPVPRGEGEVYLVVGATLSDRQEALDRLLVALAIGGPVLLVITSVLGWWLAGAALRPVERLRREAAAIQASEPGRRLAVPGTEDELARLASTLNAMLERLEGSLERERRFVDDAAHELRTPLAVLKGEIDLALSRSRTPEELVGALRSASVEADRLAGLAEDLLVLSRAEGGRLPVHRVPVETADLVRDATAAVRARAEAAEVRLEAQITEGAVRLDPARLRQALDNMLDNAIRHSPPGGTVTVTGEHRDGRFLLKVQDEGGGFPAGFQDQAFAAFTRRDTGGDGAGLGLAIVGAIAQAHGGTATAENLPGSGACVTLDLPVEP